MKVGAIDPHHRVSRQYVTHKYTVTSHFRQLLTKSRFLHRSAATREFDNEWRMCNEIMCIETVCIYWLGAPSESIATSSVSQLPIEHALEA